MAKHKKVIITQEGYIFLAAVGVLILALIVVAVATSGFGACAPREKATSGSPTIGPSDYHPAPTGTPQPTPEEEPNLETSAPATPSAATDAPSSTDVPLTDDPNALTAPTAEMIAGAAEGKLTKSGVRMRQGPSTTTTILATGLKAGTKVTVYAEEGDFYFLLVNETKKYGYISKQFVKLLTTLGETSDGKDQPEGTVKGTITATNLALREGTSVTSKALGQFNEGKLVYIYYQEGDYYYVLVAGTELKGYLFAQFVKPEGTVPPKE